MGDKMANALLVSLGEVKDEIGLLPTESELDDILQSMLNEVFSLWEELTERTWELTSLTEYYNGQKNMSKLSMRNYPIISVTSIHDDAERIFGSDTEIPTADIHFDSPNGIIFCGGFNVGFQNIKVIYTTGYTLETVPKWLKAIIKRQVAHWHRQRTANTSDLFSVSIHAGGGTTSFKSLHDNLLPDFYAAAQRNRRMGF